MRNPVTAAWAAGLFAVMCGFGVTLRGSPQTAQEPSAAKSAAQVYRESGCSHCHMLNGDGGRKGPDLSNVGRRMSVDGIRRQIQDGGGAMPPYQDALSVSELDSLVEMLHRARKSR